MSLTVRFEGWEERDRLALVHALDGDPALSHVETLFLAEEAGDVIDPDEAAEQAAFAPVDDDPDFGAGHALGANGA